MSHFAMQTKRKGNEAERCCHQCSLEQASKQCHARTCFEKVFQLATDEIGAFHGQGWMERKKEIIEDVKCSLG